MNPIFFRLLPALALTVLVAGCDIPGLGPDPRIAQRESDAKAIGAACRYAMRGIEDCFRLNERAPKTAIYEGWKEMDLYMRENKLEGLPSQITSAPASSDVTLNDGQAPASAGKSTKNASH